MNKYFLILVGLAILQTLGCGGSSATSERVHNLNGKVLHIADDRASLTIDHEDIPGLMPEMLMDLRLETPHLLAGISIGDLVEGKLQVDSEGNMRLIALRKVDTVVVTPENEAKKLEMKIQAARNRLTPEDRRLVEAQDYCPVETESRLGSMGAPFKLELEGKIVFLCCSGCDKAARHAPSKTLATVEHLKAQAAQRGK